MLNICETISITKQNMNFKDKKSKNTSLIPDEIGIRHKQCLLSYAEEFTRVYHKNLNAGKGEREAACLAVMLREGLQPLQDEDLLAGRYIVPPIGISAEPGGLGYYINKTVFEQLRDELSHETKTTDRINALLNYWQGNTTSEQVRANFDEYTLSILPSDDYISSAANTLSFPLYRIAGCQLDYEKLLAIGLPGLHKEVNALPSGDFRNGLLAILKLFQELCEEYASHAENRGALPLSNVLKNITHRPPESFHEALQLSWLYSIVSGVMNYGRMDDYLGRFLVHDLDYNILKHEEAKELLSCQWQIMACRNTIWNGRVILGGRGRKHEIEADRFALLALEVHRELRLCEPQLSLRFYKEQNPTLYNLALELIGEGLTYPILYNDDVNIPAVSTAMGIDKKLAQDYLPFGCGEYMINYRSIGSPNGLLNMACLLNDILAENNQYSCFEELYADFENACIRELRALALAQVYSYDITAKNVSLLFISLLYNNCLERNLPLLDGGVLHRGGTIECYGNTNTADSLSAINELVFEKRAFTISDFRNAIAANFLGYEKLLHHIKLTSKYGNDIPQVDALAKRIHDTVCTAAIKAGKEVGLDSYLVVMINNSANSIFGNQMGATPDGRRALKPLANANNPQSGADKNGITAMLNSLTIITNDNNAGVVQNLRLQKHWFTQNLSALKSLIQGYFDNGGTQIMITVTSRQELISAMRDPESHGWIMVRVGGFSAKFIDLPPNIQEEIISRSDY